MLQRARVFGIPVQLLTVTTLNVLNAAACSCFRNSRPAAHCHHPPPLPQRPHNLPKVHPQLLANPHHPPHPAHHHHAQSRPKLQHLDSKICRGCCFSTRTSVSNNVCMDHLHCNPQQIN